MKVVAFGAAFAAAAAVAGTYVMLVPGQDAPEAELPRAERPADEPVSAVDQAAEAVPDAGAESDAGNPDGANMADVARLPEGQPEHEPDTQPAAGDFASQEPAAEEPVSEESEERQGPRFDIVRVEPTGEAVIAGRGAPESEVTVLEDGKPIATGRTDRRGEFVILPETPFAPGQRQLTLTTRDREGREEDSEEVVVVTIPDLRDAAPSEEKVVAEADAAEPESGAGAAVSEETAVRGEQPEAVARAPEADAPTREAALGEPELPTVVLVPRGEDGELRVLQQSGPAAGLEAAGLRLETIRYTVDGRIDIRGRAESGGRVVLLINGTVIGEATVASDGSWRIVSAEDIPPGLHTLRVEQRGADDTVIAEVETPFSSQPMISAAGGEGFIVIQPGHTLWSIAERTYGGGWRYTLIHEANVDQIADPDLIYPGQVFILPERESGG